MYGQLYRRLLEHTKTLALKTAKGDFGSHVSLTEDCKKELQWWVDNIVSSHNVITYGQPSNTLTTDASQNGWGAVYNDTSIGGFWSDEKKITSHKLPPIISSVHGPTNHITTPTFES